MPHPLPSRGGAATGPSVLGSLDPRLIELACDIGMNVLAYRHEEPFSLRPLPGSDRDYVAGEVLNSISFAEVRTFTADHFNDDIMLAGFERAAKPRREEIGMISWSTEDNPDAFRQLLATRGGRTSVGLPTGRVLPRLLHRRALGIRTRVLVVHNHPAHPLRSGLEKLLGSPPGPSGADRDAMLQWGVRLWLESNLLIEPEFFLYENDKFQRIRWPAVAQVLDWVKIYGPQVAPFIDGARSK